MTNLACRKCPYFDKKQKKDSLVQGSVIVGFCRLRQMHISDVTITGIHCKDRAVISIPHSQNDSQKVSL